MDAANMRAIAQQALAALAAPTQQATPSESVKQEAMQMLWDDQQLEEKEHYRNVARGAELPLHTIHHLEDIDKAHAAQKAAAQAVHVDAARLDWLERRGSVAIERVKRISNLDAPAEYEVTPYNDDSYDGATLRAAIDAARAAQGVK